MNGMAARIEARVKPVPNPLYGEAEFGVTRAVTAADFKKLIELGLAEQVGQGRSTRYGLKAAS